MSNKNPWDHHLELLSRIANRKPIAERPPPKRAVFASDDDAREAVRHEWDARPPGPLGRRLLGEIGPYLDFFATARSQ